MVRERTFREDLFYRINLITVTLPRCASARMTYPCSSTISSAVIAATQGASDPKSPATLSISSRLSPILATSAS